MSALQAVVAAWRDAGPVPGYHARKQTELRRTWPVLGRALDALPEVVPVTVTTAAQLDALPGGSVVLDGRGRASQKYGDGKWWRTADVNPTLGGRASDTVLRYGPCIVVWVQPVTEATL